MFFKESENYICLIDENYPVKNIVIIPIKIIMINLIIIWFQKRVKYIAIS